MTFRCRTASSRAPTPSAASHTAGVGPRQRGNDGDTDAIGGKTYAIGTVEMTFPLGLPEEWGIEGAVFSDFGTVFNSGVDTVLAGTGRLLLRQQYAAGTGPMRRTAPVFDTAAFRLSVGAGVIWAVALRTAALRGSLSAAEGGLRQDRMVPLLRRHRASRRTRRSGLRDRRTAPRAVRHFWRTRRE